MNACIEECKAKFDYPEGGVREDADKMIAKAFSFCKDNTDAMDIVKMHIQEITTNAERSIRTEGGVRKKVDGILDNLKELKELSRKNPAIYTAGKIMLKESGVALPKGMIAKMVQACNAAPLGGLRKLSDASPATSIHDVVVQLYKSINHVMISSGAEDKMEKPEKMAARDFIASTILSRCSVSTLQNIRSALDTDEAACLQEYYSVTEAGGNMFVEEESKAVQETVVTTGTIGRLYIETLDVNVNRNLDRLEPNVQHNRIQSYNQQVNVDVIGGKSIINRTIGLANEIIEGRLQDVIDKTVQGTADRARTPSRQHLSEKLANPIILVLKFATAWVLLQAP